MKTKSSVIDRLALYLWGIIGGVGSQMVFGEYNRYIIPVSLALILIINIIDFVIIVRDEIK